MHGIKGYFDRYEDFDMKLKITLGEKEWSIQIPSHYFREHSAEELHSMYFDEFQDRFKQLIEANIQEAKKG